MDTKQYQLSLFAWNVNGRGGNSERNCHPFLRHVPCLLGLNFSLSLSLSLARAERESIAQLVYRLNRLDCFI
jgi:hypothetical protein